MLPQKNNTLRLVREHFHYNQKQVADALNTTTSNYSRIERHEFLPKLATLKLLAIFYNCTIEFIENFTPPVGNAIEEKLISKI